MAQTRAAYIDGQLAKAGWHLTSVDLQAEDQVGSKGQAQHGFSAVNRATGPA